MICLSVLFAFLLTGCTPRGGSEIPKEVPVSGEIAVQETPPEREEKEEKQEGNQKNQPVRLVPASVTVTTTDGQKSWKTQDDILAKHFYELLFLVNESFRQPLDIREHDYNVVVKDGKGEQEAFQLWVNFERENEVIVEDAEGKQWNLFLSDSDKIRILLYALA